MSLYTPMPLELVFDGWSRGPGPFVDLTIRGVTMRVVPVSPGVGKIERLLNAPLDLYLQPEFQPGQIIFYTGNAAAENPEASASATSGVTWTAIPDAGAGIPPQPFPG